MTNLVPAFIRRLYHRLLSQPEAGTGVIRSGFAPIASDRHDLRLDAGASRRKVQVAISESAHAKISDSVLNEIQQNPEALFVHRLQYWCKREKYHRVGAVSIPTPFGNLDAFLKCHECKDTLGKLKSILWPSSARRAWAIGQALLRHDLATPRPILFVEQHGRFSDRYYLLTEAVPHAMTVAEFFARHWPHMKSAERRDWSAIALPTLANQLKRMHQSRFDHRDLKFQNILVADAPDSEGGISFWLMDLEGVRRWLWLPRRRSVQNLARLNVSSLQISSFRSSDRLRFLKHYLQSRFRSEWKQWWRDILQLSNNKIQKNLDNGRSLS